MGRGAGAGTRALGVPGERELETKGVTYCAACDGALPMFRDQAVVVVGGGDSACEEATFLTRFASKVYLVHRRGGLRGAKIIAGRGWGKTHNEAGLESGGGRVGGAGEGGGRGGGGGGGRVRVGGGGGGGGGVARRGDGGGGGEVRCCPSVSVVA